MKRDDGDLNLFKLVGVLLVLFYLFVYFGTSFVTAGSDSKEDTKTIQAESTAKQDNKLEAKEEDAEILGKFYNEKGYFIVVYNGITKAPEVIKVDYSEWQYMRIGEKY